MFVFITLQGLPLLADVSWKSLLLFLAAGLLTRLLRCASAAYRHLIWLLAILGAFCLPLCSLLLPHWQVSLPASVISPPRAVRSWLPAASSDPLHMEWKNKPLPQSPPAPVAEQTGAYRDAKSALHIRSEGAAWSDAWPLLLFCIWLIGTAVLGLRLLRDIWRVSRITQQCEPIIAGPLLLFVARLGQEMGLQHPIALRRALLEGAAIVPMTWGFRHPVICLPASSAEWPLDCVRAVLLHELAHIRRGDWLTQILAQGIRALYWFHPLVWVAVTRLQTESEEACDDRVLNAGVGALAYACHLLEVIQAMQKNRRNSCCRQRFGAEVVPGDTLKSRPGESESERSHPACGSRNDRCPGGGVRAAGSPASGRTSAVATDTGHTDRDSASQGFTRC